MDIVIVGAGPTGSFLAIACARRGHRVTVVDRATGPLPDGSWPRRGVMQFHQPHAFRPQVADAFKAEMPDVLDALQAAGVVLVPDAYRLTGMPNMSIMLRRSRLDPVMWRALAGEPGVTMVAATARDVRGRRDGRLEVLTRGGAVDADLVVDATGGTQSFADGLRAPGEEIDSGLAYVSRQYRLLPGARAHLPENMGGRWTFRGYEAIVFEHDADVITVLFERLAADRGLAGLREAPAFEAAVAAVEPLATRTDSRYVETLSPVRPGGRLRNRYRGQLMPDGTAALPGLLHAGDAVCSPSPRLGRGTTTALLQARKLLDLLDRQEPVEDLTYAFDRWCHEQVRPWFEDQARDDAVTLRLWRDGDLDLSVTPASKLVLGANADDSEVSDLLNAYAEMEVLPAALEPLLPRTRARLAEGWRPAMTPGPDAAQLAVTIAAAGR
jgi:2-polyprenyl-6-methoxyphenol hydroxylase-like FAD-dependent oxidoreductase